MEKNTNWLIMHIAQEPKEKTIHFILRKNDVWKDTSPRHRKIPNQVKSGAELQKIWEEISQYSHAAHSYGFL